MVQVHRQLCERILLLVVVRVAHISPLHRKLAHCRWQRRSAHAGDVERSRAASRLPLRSGLRSPTPRSRVFCFCFRAHPTHRPMLSVACVQPRGSRPRSHGGAPHAVHASEGRKPCCSGGRSRGRAAAILAERARCDTTLFLNPNPSHGAFHPQPTHPCWFFVSPVASSQRITLCAAPSPLTRCCSTCLFVVAALWMCWCLEAQLRGDPLLLRWCSSTLHTDCDRVSHDVGPRHADVTLFVSGSLRSRLALPLPMHHGGPSARHERSLIAPSVTVSLLWVGARWRCPIWQRSVVLPSLTSTTFL